MLSYTLCAISSVCLHHSQVLVLQFRLLANCVLTFKGDPTCDLSKLMTDCSEASSSPTFDDISLAAPRVSSPKCPPSSCIRQQARDYNSTVARSCTYLAPSASWGPDLDGQLLNAPQPEEVKFAAERSPHAQPWLLVARCRRRLLTTAWTAPRTRITQACNPGSPC